MLTRTKRLFFYIQIYTTARDGQTDGIDKSMRGRIIYNEYNALLIVHDVHLDIYSVYHEKELYIIIEVDILYTIYFMEGHLDVCSQYDTINFFSEKSNKCPKQNASRYENIFRNII